MFISIVLYSLFNSDALDELRRLANEPDPDLQLNEIETIPEPNQIDLTERELNIERIQMEENFPMPMENDIGQVSVVLCCGSFNRLKYLKKKCGK